MKPRALHRLAGLLVLALQLLPAPAQAMSIRELRTLEAQEAEGRNRASYYLVGVLEGLREAADAAQRAGARPAFCANGRRLEPAMARPLYEGELRRNADLYEADMPVPLVLAAALQAAYRCEP
ncbi:hypothetical protein PGB34_03940 [Xenophilus arseniciresistens]|uniref:Rap1a immunity protein domain-containing protein n=1 Tax=Xenophilus arseniciresistens TaxID=1283306 RepID=A0AAE3SZ56_9BURK|nr:hypothetical protein [Xenophilus arseniciresistens]MDA7415506.1 hypothetical protein [Xenophilus arseniciresistens]